MSLNLTIICVFFQKIKIPKRMLFHNKTWCHSPFFYCFSIAIFVQLFAINNAFCQGDITDSLEANNEPIQCYIKTMEGEVKYFDTLL